jgi:hypothetical protein
MRTPKEINNKIKNKSSKAHNTPPAAAAAAMDAPTDDASVGLFEVFKMGHLPLADVAALSDEELRRRYSLLLPFTDRAQLQPPCQLAALPKPGMWLWPPSLWSAHTPHHNHTWVGWGWGLPE